MDNKNVNIDKWFCATAYKMLGFTSRICENQKIKKLTLSYFPMNRRGRVNYFIVRNATNVDSHAAVLAGRARITDSHNFGAWSRQPVAAGDYVRHFWGTRLVYVVYFDQRLGAVEIVILSKILL